MAGKRKIYVTINPKSGFGRKTVISDRIESRIDRSLCELKLIFTEHPGHATQIARKAVEEKADAVVAVGGDGSINEIGKVLVDTDTALGIIPRGSGNGLARSLKIPFNLSGAVDVINNFRTRKIDTGAINGVVFINIAGVGFDGLVAEKYAALTTRGFFGYFSIVASEFASYKPKKYKLVIDGHKIKTRALLISFANSKQFGYNTTIAPKASLDDGLLDVCIIQKPLVIEFPILAHMMYMNRIDESKYIETFKAKEIKLKRKKNRTINIDGEPIIIDTDLSIKVNPSSLNVIVP